MFDGANWDETRQSGQAPDDPEDLRAPPPGERRRRSCLIRPDGKTQLYNGRTGERTTSRSRSGMRILKLSHLVDDKIHARSTGRTR
ncbi:MAG: hypothetical protein R2715_24795 [Ilumatobacteraceae bacterium]